MNTANRFLLENINLVLQGGVPNTRDSGYEVRTKIDGEPAHYFQLGSQMWEYDIRKGDFPINTLRKFNLDKAWAEMLWIYVNGSNRIVDAHALGFKFWDPWANPDGTIGQRYGHTVARYDQFSELLHTFIKDPLSRRKMTSLWQLEEFRDDPHSLKPCAHTTNWHMHVEPDGRHSVTLTLTQRALDLMITSSHNAFQYVALGMYVCSRLRILTGKNYQLDKFRHDIGSVDLYENHLDLAKEIAAREPVDDYHVNMDVNYMRTWDPILRYYVPPIEPTTSKFKVAI